MKFLITLIVFVVSTQAKSVSILANLQPIQRCVTPNPLHTAEWDAIYAAAEADIPENITGLVLGTVPSPETAGKVYVKPTERIISGTAASQGQFPWQALVIPGQISLCGGSLISPQWVLTAAHCITGHNTFHITLGSTSRTITQSGTVTQYSRQAITHANYNAINIANDIGLLRLTSAVSITNYINVVRLPVEASNSFAGSAATVSGFGRINSGNNEVSNNLLYANVEIITNTECARTLGALLQATNICSFGSNGRTPCTGDSGGPLVVQESDGPYTLVGIVSFGSCQANKPAAYARVSKYLAWISSHSGVAVRA